MSRGVYVRKTTNPIERCWRYIEPEPNSGCWLWMGARDGADYGALKVNGLARRAHRVMYEVEVGPIPSGLELDHTCRVRACVNPVHVEPVTHQENLRRGEGSKTFCRHGHEFTQDNTRRYRDGSRQCVQCHRRRSLAYVRRRRSMEESA